MWETLKKWVGGKMGLKENRVYNHADNIVYVKTNGNSMYIICKSEDQMDKVVKRMTNDNCKLSGYEEWDEDEEKKWVLTFDVALDEQIFKSNMN